MANPTAYLLMHDAIRLDLRRLADVTTGLAEGRQAPSPARLAALRDHLADVLNALHHHHVAEDQHLWPLLRERGLPTGDLDALSADHDELDVLIQHLRAGLDAAAVAHSGFGELAEIAGRLRSLMDVHLATEEVLIVPAIEGMVTDADLTRLEKRMNHASDLRMSFVLPWLAEADPRRLGEIVGRLRPVLPAVLGVLGRGYRRRLATAYGAGAVDHGPVRLRGVAEIFIPAPADEVYAAVSDVLRMGSYSPECYRCEWLDGASGPLVGARFQGWNRFRGMGWTRECEVVTAEPGRAFAFRTRRTASRRDTTLWRFELREHDGGTHLRQTFELSAGAGIMLFERLTGRDASTPVAMRQTLERLRDDLTGAPTDGPLASARPGATGATRDTFEELVRPV